jgi:hypothetical protein
MTDEAPPAPEGILARDRARQLAVADQPLHSIAWSLIAMSDDLAAIRRDSDWNRRHGGTKHG